jgi:hypothetical protein
VKSKQPKKERAARQGGRSQASRVPPHHNARDDSQPADASVCPDCKAVFRQGRWQWAQVPDPVGLASEVCPACRRIRDADPAGEVRIRGDFAASHRDEILGLIRNLEEKEKAERPLNRLLRIESSDAELRVTTTDVHLAHAIGTALHDAWKGELRAPWTEDGDLLRVSWRR